MIKMATWWSVLLVCTLVGASWSAYLPDSTNHLDTIQQKLQQKQQQLQFSHNENAATTTPPTADEAAAMRQWQLPHESYDKNDDVVLRDSAEMASDAGDNEEVVDENENNNNNNNNNAISADSTGAFEYVDEALERIPDTDYEDIDEADEEERGDNDDERSPRRRRELSDWLIAPNTRWCGRGNTANGTYNHLGGASAADKCCRKHDHCQIYIPAMSNRYELFNYRPYTLSHCNCDRRFRTCLKMANDEDANTIGKLFFNMVQTQCFMLRTERNCLKRLPDGGCETEIVRQKAYLKSNKKF